MAVFVYLIVAIALLILALRKYIYRNQDYWKKRGVYEEPDQIGIVKALWLLLSQQKNAHEFDKDRYDRLGSSTYAGTVELGVPTIQLKDPELIKQVLVKDFDHFVDRRESRIQGEPLMDKMLVNLRSHEWKDARTLMSPTFTSGKIRRMFQNFNKSGNGLVEFIKSQPAWSPGSRDVNVKEFTSRYLIDVIGTTAFGMETSVFQDKDSEFYKYAKKVTTISFRAIVKGIVVFLFPFVQKLGVKVVDQDVKKFFMDTFRESLEERASSNKKDDFLQIMLEARKGEKNEDEGDLEEFEKAAKLGGIKKEKMEMDDEMILAQCFVFFLAGLDTTGGLLAMGYYLLALHPDIQEKLWKEVNEKMNGGEVSYEDLNKMEYMDWFISEVLRLYPPGFRLERACTKQYTLPGTSTVIEKGSIVWISAIGLHKDPKYYPEPEKFDPERWAPAEKTKRHTYTYLPFGQGPRNCIGMRFALMEAKIALAYVIYNFFIEPCSKTPIPIKQDPNVPSRPDLSLELRFKERVKA